jgi:signal transduction histidine kinase
MNYGHTTLTAKKYVPPVCVISILTTLLFVFNTPASSQLYSELEKGNLYDTASINKALKKGKAIRFTFPDSSYYYYAKSLQSSYRLNYGEGIVSSLNEMGRWYYSSNIDLAILNAQTALKEYDYQKLNNNTLKDQVFLLLAKSYEGKGILDSAAYYYYYLNEEIEKGKIKDPYFELSLYTTLALFWLNNSDKIGVEYAEPVKNFIIKGQHTLSRVPASANSYADLYQLQAFYYQSIARFDSARFYFLKQVELCETNTPMPSNLPSVLLNISNTYILENKPAEAIPYLMKAIGMFKSAGSQERYQIIANLQLATAYYLQKKYKECLFVLNGTWRNFNMNVLTKEIIDAYKIYGDSYEALGMKDKAMTYKNTYINLYDSFVRADKLNMMYKLESRYRLSEKDKKLAEQNLTISLAENNAHQKNFWVAGLSFIAFATILIFILWQRSNRHKQRLQAYSFEKQIEISRLTYTIQGEEKERNRIASELHDGIGGLLAAAKINLDLVKKEYHFNNESNFIEVIHLIDQAASDLRKTAHNMMPEILMQDGLMKALEQFCNSIAAKNTTSIYFEILGSPVKLNEALELSLYRIVQELVHNIIKHAKATEAFIQISFSEEELNITVEDNGIGMSVINENARGMGIKSIHDRVKAINGKINFESGYARGTSIYINIDLQKENIKTI